jgi:hypothetical protein
VELIVVSSLEGAPSFSKGTLRRIEERKRIYGVALDAAAAQTALWVDVPGRRAASGAGRGKRASRGGDDR